MYLFQHLNTAGVQKAHHDNLSLQTKESLHPFASAMLGQWVISSDVTESKNLLHFYSSYLLLKVLF